MLMIVFAQEDLYTEDPSPSQNTPPPVVESPAPASPTTEIKDLTPAEESQPSLILENFSWDFVFINLNLLILAWTIVYSTIMIFDYLMYKFALGQNRIEADKKAGKSILSFFVIWATYLVTLPFLFFFLNTQDILKIVLGLFLVILYLLKIYIDTIQILNVLTYFEWSKKIVTGLKDKLIPKFEKKK